MNKHYFHYLLAFVYGIYFFLLQEVIFFIRFGRFNTNLSWEDASLYVIGVASMLLVFYFLHKLKTQSSKRLLILSFCIAVALSLITSLFGGLLGVYGSIAYGIAPFIIILTTGYLVFRQTDNAKTL